MASNLPSLIFTGASGIVGCCFLAAAQDLFKIYPIVARLNSFYQPPRSVSRRLANQAHQGDR